MMQNGNLILNTIHVQFANFIRGTPVFCGRRKVLRSWKLQSMTSMVFSVLNKLQGIHDTQLPFLCMVN